MSLYDYEQSLEILHKDYPFYAMVMALAYKADDKNLLKLEIAWPGVVEETRKRYNAPGGVLEGDKDEG